MSDLVKTGSQIWNELQDKIKDTDKPLTRMFDKEVFQKYLVLPSGLDVFEYSIFGHPEVKIGNFTQTKLRGF